MSEESYVRSYSSAMSKSPYYNNYFDPFIINEVLKNINMNPAGKTRTELLPMIHDPKKFERPLRQFAQYLYNVQMPFKRLIHYFANMLTYDLSIYPINASDKDMKTDKFKRDYDAVFAWLDNFNHKKEFKRINTGMLIEDAKFMYLRQDSYSKRIAFQEMPSDYCMIDGSFEYGWLYSFDLQYFMRQGVDINGFAPEFKEYYNDYVDLVSNNTYKPNIKVEQRDGRWCYWQQILPKNSWVFKFHSIFAGLIPPMLGLFLDANEIDTFKNLQSDKTALELFKLLVGIIPTNKSKDGTLTDDLAISAEMAGEFNRLMNDMLPDGIKFGTVPFSDVKQYDFSNGSQTKDNVVGDAINNFYSTSGSDMSLFNSNKPNATTLKMSTANDVSFANTVYDEFSSFLDYQISFLTKKYKFKTKLEGSIYDRDERQSQAINLAQYGIITPQLPASMGLTEKEFRSGLALMKTFEYENLLTPLQSANNMSSNQTDAGRPAAKEENLNESGIKTRDADSNADR